MEFVIFFMKMNELRGLINLLKQKGFTVNFDHKEGSNMMQCRFAAKTTVMDEKSYLIGPMIATIISPVDEKDAAIKMFKLMINKLKENGYMK